MPRTTRQYNDQVTPSDPAARLSPADRELLDNVLANAALEGQDIPPDERDLAVAYLAGDIDVDTYLQQVRQHALAGIRRASQSA